MNSTARGISAVGIIVAFVAIVIIGGGIVYFTSDVWKTRMDAQYEQFAHWTPENIAQDPVNYLNFCEAQVEEALADLEASRIAAAQQISRFEAMMETEQEKINTGDRTLEELKGKYKQAEADDAWPVQYGGMDRDRQWMRRQIVSLHGELANSRRLVEQWDSAIEQLRNQQAKIREQKNEAQRALSTIETQREMVKVQKITDELTEQLVDMKAMVASMTDATIDPDQIKTLDQIAAESESTVDEAEFEAILNE